MRGGAFGGAYRPAIGDIRRRTGNIFQQHNHIIGADTGRVAIDQSDGGNRGAVALQINRRVALGLNAARPAIGEADRIGPDIGDANSIIALNGGGGSGRDGAAIGNRHRRAIGVEKNRAAAIGVAIGQRIADG